jgi:hypothetical protein
MVAGVSIWFLTRPIPQGVTRTTIMASGPAALAIDIIAAFDHVRRCGSRDKEVS